MLKFFILLKLKNFKFKYNNFLIIIIIFLLKFIFKINIIHNFFK